MKKTVIKVKSESTIQEQAIEYAKLIVLKIAKKNEIPDDDLEDVMQEAIVWALEKLPDFNPDKKCKLNTFIQKAVEGNVLKYLKKYGHVVRNSEDNTCYINSLENEFNSDDEKKPRWEETMADADEKEKREQEELLEHLRVFLKMLPEDEKELIMVRFQFTEVHETVTEYIKRKKITRTVFYRKSDAIVLKLKRLMAL